jgi:hypothetical protein
MGLLSALFVWKFVPETKGKTLEQIEGFWIKKTDIPPVLTEAQK